MEPVNTQAVPFNVAVAMTDTPLLGPNPDRFAVTFSPPAANRYTISFGNSVALDAGVNVPAASQALTLTAVDVGNGIKEPIHAIFAVAGATVCGVEWTKVK